MIKLGVAWRAELYGVVSIMGKPMESYRPIADEATGEREACGNCVCWLAEAAPVGGVLFGACRHSPHVVVAVEDARQPREPATAWCRQWEARPAELIGGGETGLGGDANGNRLIRGEGEGGGP